MAEKMRAVRGMEWRWCSKSKRGDGAMRRREMLREALDKQSASPHPFPPWRGFLAQVLPLPPIPCCYLLLLHFNYLHCFPSPSPFPPLFVSSHLSVRVSAFAGRIRGDKLVMQYTRSCAPFILLPYVRKDIQYYDAGVM